MHSRVVSSFSAQRGIFRRCSEASRAGTGRARSLRCAPKMPATTAKAPVILLDIMDTVVKDPFYTHMAGYFDLSFDELLTSKHPTAWVEFERGEISEDELLAKFFKDGRDVSGPGLVRHMSEAYVFIEGMEGLLHRLSQAGFQLHACSNYPSWWRLIEDRLAVGRYLEWTFISCEGPMKGLRKPSPECFEVVVHHMGVPPADLIFVDDRQGNVDAAAAAGLTGLRFSSAAQLESDLRALGLHF